VRLVKAGEFKARCLELMDQVAMSGRAIVITKRGQPVAQLAPVTTKPETLRGFLQGRVKVTGDVVSPVEVDWDALRP